MVEKTNNNNVTHKKRQITNDKIHAVDVTDKRSMGDNNRMMTDKTHQKGTYQKREKYVPKTRKTHILHNTTHETDALLKQILDEDKGMIFIAASGVEQIGMNLNIFGYKGKFIIVDVGISFTELGSGVMLPSTNILHELGEENILAYVITHAHEDHIGGLCRFLKEIKKPIYTTKFTMCIIEEKLKENGIKDTERIIVEPDKMFKLGDFDILFTNTAHSIPDSNHILIKTPHGTVFHTGDWKFDSAPVLGQPSDLDHLEAIGKKYKITALINDSTNAHEFKKIGTELEAQQGLRQHITDAENKKQRITVTCFSSNLARIKSLELIARETGRTIVLIGRSLLKMVTVGIRLKLLDGRNIVLDAKKASHLEPSKTLFVCTGSQGEVNSALQRCVLNLHPILKLTKDDVVIFSSRIIPGNEKKIAESKNALLNRGVKIIDHNTAREDFEVVHVSGHPGRDDIVNMVKRLKPDLVIPVHGDQIHFMAVKESMDLIKCPCILPKGNGTVFRIHDKDGTEILGKLDTHTEIIDGIHTYPIHDDIFRQRAALNDNGMIVIIINRRKKNFLLNYGAVSKTEWETSLRNNLLKLIDKGDFLDPEQVRNDISYWIYKKYEKNPIIVVDFASA